MTDPRLTTLSSLIHMPTMDIESSDVMDVPPPTLAPVAVKYLKRTNYQYKKRDLETWKEECATLHKGKYDYSEVTEQMAHLPLPIICPIHGRFMQRKSNHLEGQGCPKCAAANRSLTEDSITKILAEVNPAVMYVSGYINTRIPATFKGTECGHTWETSPNSVVYHRSKCPVCVQLNHGTKGRSKPTSDEYQVKLDKIRGGKFLIISPYRGSQLRAEFKCLVCDNTFPATPSQMIHGHKKCPHCRAE